MDRIHGSATIKRDGTNIIVDVTAKLKIGGDINNVSVHGRKAFNSVNTIASELEIKIPHTTDVDLIKEQSRSGVEIQFHSDNGAVYVVPSSAQTGEVDSGDDGLVALVYTGDPATKL